MLVNMKCPSCGATMQFDDTRESMDCPYCGSKVANLTEQVNINQNVNVSGTVVHVQDRTNEPNLYISYNTNNPSVGMMFRIVSNGVKGACVNGQTLSYHLNQGPHTIVLKIGKKNYNRDIVIPPDNQPVRIYAAFNGRGQITVDQPNVSPVSASSAGGAQTSQVQNPVPRPAGKPKSPLSILAFVLSLTFYLSWAGAGLGAVETFVLDKEKEKNHIFSFIAMGLGLLLTISLIANLAGGGSKSKKAEATVATTTAAVTVEETQPTTAATTAATTQTTVDVVAQTEDTDEETDEDTDVDSGDENGDIDPELKKFLDSYEAFMDEYIEFLVKYEESPNDITLITEYATMQIKYAEFVKTCENYEAEEMSEADSAYYLEVITRINQKLIDASVTISE